jgi:hypothetical protein
MKPAKAVYRAMISGEKYISTKAIIMTTTIERAASL